MCFDVPWGSESLGSDGGILLRAMAAATLSFLAIRRGGDVEGGRAEQGGRAAHGTEDGTEAGACAAARGDRASRAAEAPCGCGGCSACCRGRAARARACDR